MNDINLDATLQHLKLQSLSGAAEAQQQREKLQEELDAKRRALNKMEKPIKEGEGLTDSNENPFLLGPPKLNWLQSLGSVQDAYKEVQQLHDAEGYTNASESGADGAIEPGDGELLRDCMRCAQASGAGTFRARENTEMDQLKRRQVYESVLIRLVFPNKMTLEFRCKPQETIRTLYRKVDMVVRDELFRLNYAENSTKNAKGEVVKSNSVSAGGSSLYLYDTPPIRKFDCTSRKTLVTEGLAPAAALYVGLNPDASKGVIQAFAASQAASASSGSTSPGKKVPSYGGQTISSSNLPQEPAFYLKAEYLSQLPPKPKEVAPVATSHASRGIGGQAGNSGKSRLVGGGGDSPKTGTGGGVTGGVIGGGGSSGSSSAPAPTAPAPTVDDGTLLGRVEDACDEYNLVSGTDTDVKMGGAE